MNASDLRLRHLHYLFGNAVGLLFVFIPRLVDCQFRPDCARSRRVDGNAAKIVTAARRPHGLHSGIGYFSMSLEHPLLCLDLFSPVRTRGFRGLRLTLLLHESLHASP